MRVAFFGGSFDPPHRGHLAIARAACRRLALDRVWMAPVGAQPFKLDAPATSYRDRLAMVELATAGHSCVAASALDAPRSDGTPNYTFDALAALKAELGTDDRLFFLLGADAFLSLKDWHRAEELPLLCDLIVAGRPGAFLGDLLGDLAGALPPGIEARRAPEADLASDHEAALLAWELRGRGGERSTLYLMPDLREQVSATQIRAALAAEDQQSGDPAGDDATRVLCPEVLRYIRANGLYR
jgi:nicotinate-nucleotide adenylyltransferase